MLDPLLEVAKELAAVGALAIAAAAILGYLADKETGGLALATTALVATLVCLAGFAGFALLGLALKPGADQFQRASRSLGWGKAGLVIAVITVAGLGAFVGRKLGNSRTSERRASYFICGLWLGYCLASWIGYRAGRWIGLLTITIPAVVLLWLSLYYLSRHLLPLDTDQPTSEAFRSLITFWLGTNYPYYALEQRTKVERVPGNQYTMLLAGPGIFLAGPDHVVAVSDGMRFKGVRGPGVVFTRAFEGIQEPMDLRPQLRATPVEALTKDGICLKFTTYGLFQLDAGERQPTLGAPFPFRARSVFKAFHKRPMEIRRQERDGEIVEQRERRQWEDMYEIVGKHVAQDIIGEYTFDELCEPFRPDEDPRGRIAREYREKLNEAIREYGIRVRGAGVSNLLPAERDLVLRRRVANWQAEWQRRMMEQRGEAEAEGERLMGQARAQVQAEIIERISEAIAVTTPEDTESIFNTVALRFVESLNRMVAQPPIREQLPPDVLGTVDRLPYIIGRS